MKSTKNKPLRYLGKVLLGSRRWLWISIFTCFLLTGCKANRPLGMGDLSLLSGDILSMALIYNLLTGDLDPQNVVLEDVHNLESLNGDFIQLLFATTFSSLVSVSATEFQITFENGPSLKINYIKKDGRFIPVDYPSFRLVSTYYNFVNARNQFLSLLTQVGVSCSNCFKKRIVYVDPIDQTGSLTGTDNAAFVQGMDSFLIFLQNNFNFVNMGMNPTIVAHEVFHSIFDHLVGQAYVSTAFIDEFDFAVANLKDLVFDHGGLLLTTLHDEGDVAGGQINFAFSIADFTAESYTVINIVNEGLGDYFALYLTGNPDILFLSTNNTTLSTPRQLDIDHAFLQSSYDDIKAGAPVQCNTTLNVNTCQQLRLRFQYLVGSVFARSLVEIGEEIGNHDQVAQIVVKFLAQFNTRFATASSVLLVPVIAEMIADGVTAGFQTEFCKHFQENFSAITSEISAATPCP